ncbi:MAG: type II toxin-antitoxin system RelE/ParE family toxin [Patescibacteria group bacterium]
MALYKVEITKKVRKKDLPAIPPKDVSRIVERIKKLADNLYPADSTRFKGRLEYRIRQGDYRILYLVEEEIITVFVIKVGHRKTKKTT